MKHASEVNAQHRVIATAEMFCSTLTQASVYPREVVTKALAGSVAAVILCHNHPSGMPEPSHSVVALTRTLCQILALVDTRVLDHIVVAGTTSVSFTNRGLL